MQNSVYKESIDNIYNSITSFSNGDNILRKEKDKTRIQNIIKQYECYIDTEDKKKAGSFYTDISIVRFMLQFILGSIDIISNPFIKILDPSCGCGYFLTEAYEILKDRYIKNISLINEKHPGINLSKENIHEHILQNNIFGADYDSYAAKLTVINLMLKKPDCRKLPNIICCDSIINWEDTLLRDRGFWQNRFDVIVGNPPYIGHKKVSGQYRKTLNSIYGDVFKDKADISFCFIKSSIDRLAEGGRLCFITSRYFMESPSGKALRRYIKLNSTIDRIIDFYGVRIMKGISVDPVIIVLRKTIKEGSNSFEVSKAEPALKEVEYTEIFSKLEKNESNEYLRLFTVVQEDLKDDGWVLCPHNELSIIKKIEDKLKMSLSDLCSSFQGIITGCDKAFILNDSMIKEFGIETDIVKRWIKNSNIKKYRVDENSFFIIYSDLIDDVSRYPNALSYISKYKERLEKRRECLNGARQWYQLQWGREQALFEDRKIIFPYKSHCNRFAIDLGSYSSADIYGLTIKYKYSSKISYEFLLGILNSRLYDFYFKSFAKKLGDNLYDYYPNTVMRLMIPDFEDKYISSLAGDIMRCSSEKETDALVRMIDERIYQIFSLTDDEIEVVERRSDI